MDNVSVPFSDSVHLLRSLFSWIDSVSQSANRELNVRIHTSPKMVDFAGAIEGSLSNLEDNGVFGHCIDVSLRVHDPEARSVQAGKQDVVPNSYLNGSIAKR